jgi:hypothetical protein
MRKILPDLDKEYPTFLDLVIEAGKFELAGIPRIFKNRNEEPSTAIGQISVTALSQKFFFYLMDIQGKEAIADEPELMALWDKKFFTINHLVKALAKSESEFREQLDEQIKVRDFVNLEYKKELDSRKRKKSIDDFSAEDMGLYLFFIGDPPAKGQKFYDQCNYYRKEKNRQYGKPKQSKFLIQRFQNVIPFISNPEKKLSAEMELKDLKTKYYEETGIKIE